MNLPPPLLPLPLFQLNQLPILPPRKQNATLLKTLPHRRPPVDLTVRMVQGVIGGRSLPVMEGVEVASGEDVR